MKKILLCIGLLGAMLQSWGQVVADFSLPATACLNQTLQPQNNSSNATNYFWDFNQGDLMLTPTAQNMGSAGGNITTGIDVVFDGTNWFGFVASRDNNTLIRLDYGVDLNSTPTQTVLSGFLANVRPADIKIVYAQGAWYGFVYGLEKLLVRIDFGTTLTNTSPTTTVVINDVGVGDGGIDVVADGTSYYVAYSKGSGVGIAQLTTITSIPTVAEKAFTTLGAGALALGDITLTKSDNQWFAFVPSYFGTKQVVKLSFGSDPLSAPIESVLPVSALGSFSPYGAQVVMDNGNYMLFLVTVEGSVIRTNLGNDLTLTPVSSTNLGNLGNVISNSLKLTMSKQGSSWFLFSVSWATGAVFKVNFPNPVSPSVPATSTAAEPVVVFNTPGTHYVSLVARNGAEANEAVAALLVENKNAPSINFSAAGACAVHDILFTPQTTDPISTYAWTFGDGNASPVGNTTHQYALADEYAVTLTVTATNGCDNTLTKPITVYNQPVADFTVPIPTVTCTNQLYNFNNTSVYDLPSNPTWQWQVDEVNTVTTEDGVMSFASADTYAVKLIAEISGCASSVVKTFMVSSVGPALDFTSEGICQNSPVTFIGAITGAVNSIQWNFGDGGTTPDEEETIHTFLTIGSFDVTLSVANAAGCSNTLTKPITIYSQPQVNFATLAPPFSCSASATHFSNTTPNPTDSNIAQWTWNFNDPESSMNTSALKNPQHTYALAGEYSVSLTATTNFLCSATLEKTITIEQSPLADFIHGPLCEDSPIAFNDAANTNKAWSWQIGSSFYAVENPEHTFANPGPHDVTLSVTGINNCIGSATRTIIIPQRLAVDFTTSKTCLLQDSEFTNTTNDAADPITDIQWNFGSAGTSTDDPAIVSFLTSGTVNVSLSTTTQSGCVYTVIKPVVISDGPVAAFTATPNSGEAPVRIEFINTSINATAYQWSFNDPNNQTSTQPSTVFTYNTPALYTATLTASDAQGCTHTTQQLIEVIEALNVSPPHPNPSTGAFTIEWKATAGTRTQLKLVDGVGREVYATQVVSVEGINQFLMDLTNRSSGLYILTLNYLGRTQSFRLIVNH